MAQPGLTVLFEPTPKYTERLELCPGEDPPVELLSAFPLVAPYHPPQWPTYSPSATVQSDAYDSLGQQPVFSPVPHRMLCRPRWLPRDMDARIKHEYIWIAVAKKSLRIAYVVPPTCKRCYAEYHFCDRAQSSCSQCKADGMECIYDGQWAPLKVYAKRKRPQEEEAAESIAGRIAANNLKPSMPMLKSVPVWADSRKAMTSALDYLSNPQPTYGGSVEIGKSGAARAVILEGQSEGFWGVGEQAGTIAVFLGGHSTSLARSALFMAQQSRVPVAVVVSHDYSVLPYRLPRAFVVLGWFWIVDAWMEPQFGLKCRFEWCPDGPMWWSSIPERKVNIGNWAAEMTADDTVRYQSNDSPGDGGAAYHCPVCRLWSEQVYTEAVCLNENCSRWFGISNPVLRPARNEPRKGVAATGLRLRPPPPVAVGADYWSGFVCQHCGQAGVRRKWKAWECSNCLMEVTDRKILQAPELHGLKLMTANKAQDALLLKMSAKSSTLTSPEGVKITKYILDEGLAYHALHDRQALVQVADSAFLDLQAASTPFNYVENFYHMLVGFEGFSWAVAPPSCAMIRDLLQTRVRQALAIDKIFDQLLFHAVPTSGPLLTIAGSHPYSVLILGSDARVTFRRHKRTERIEFNAEHGDVLGVSANMNLEVKMDGFGIVCVGRENTTKQDKPEQVEKAKKQAFNLKDWYIGPFPLQT